MKVERLIDSLERNTALFRALLGDLSAEQADARPGPSDWSVREIACHLLDEEREDFRPRLERTLEDSSRPWPPIEPERWPEKRDYQARDLEQVVEEFARERRASVEWLRGLTERTGVDWDASYEHPQLGAIRAGDLLTSWAAHDALHLRQLAQRMYQYLMTCAEPYTSDYAGTW